MPIRKETVTDLSEHISEFVGAEEIAAIHLLRDQANVDILRTYQFWEAAIARLTTGTLTPHGCPWDVELDYFGAPVRIEVKFSQEFECRFRSGVRRVMKFALPKGGGAEKASHITVLVGIDNLDNAHAWVIPSAAISKSKSITLTLPGARRGLPSRSVVDFWRCPITQTLPEVLRVWRCHLRYDQAHHQANARRTRERKSPQARLDV